MSANPIGFVHNGVVELPEEVRADPRFAEGTALELVPHQLDLRSPEEKAMAVERFIASGGIFAGTVWDGNAELEAEKQRELAEDLRWAQG